MTFHTTSALFRDTSKQETADNYSRVLFADPDGRKRVITCNDDHQWIVQVRAPLDSGATNPWRGRSFCRTKAGILLVCNGKEFSKLQGLLAFAATLPDHFTPPAARP